MKLIVINAVAIRIIIDKQIKIVAAKSPLGLGTGKTDLLELIRCAIQSIQVIATTKEAFAMRISLRFNFEKKLNISEYKGKYCREDRHKFNCFNFITC